MSERSFSDTDVINVKLFVIKIRVNYQLNANICLFGSTCFGLYAHLQEQIEFLLQMRHMVPLLQPGVLRSVRAGGEMHG